jgi:hypothetical protein
MSPGMHCIKVGAFNQNGEAYSPAACVMISGGPQYVDLIATDPLVDPPFPSPRTDSSPGQPFTFSWAECNIGNKASGSYSWTAWFDGSIVASGTQSALNASTCVRRSTLHAGVPAGSHRFEVRIDTAGQVPELDEGNNYTTYGMVVN